MRVTRFPASALLLVALAGCGGTTGTDTADPSLPRYTVEVKGMT